MSVLKPTISQTSRPTRNSVGAGVSQAGLLGFKQSGLLSKQEQKYAQKQTGDQRNGEQAQVENAGDDSSQAAQELTFAQRVALANTKLFKNKNDKYKKPGLKSTARANRAASGANDSNQNSSNPWGGHGVRLGHGGSSKQKSHSKKINSAFTGGKFKSSSTASNIRSSSKQIQTKVEKARNNGGIKSSIILDGKSLNTSGKNIDSRLNQDEKFRYDLTFYAALNGATSRIAIQPKYFDEAEKKIKQNMQENNIPEQSVIMKRTTDENGSAVLDFKIDPDFDRSLIGYEFHHSEEELRVYLERNLN